MRTFLKFILHYVNPLNSFLGLLSFCMFLICVIYFFFRHYLSIQLSDSIYWPAALAVTGFGLIKFIECRSKRYSVLCNLEVELNQAMDVLSILIATLRFLIKDAVPVLLPHDLPYLTMRYIEDVGRLDIKNNLADLKCDFRRINQDWNNLIEYGREHLDIIKDQRHPQHQGIKSFGTQLLQYVLARSETALKLVQDTLVLVRIYMRSDRPLLRFEQPFIWPCEFLIEIGEEREKLISEVKGRQ